MIGICGTRIEYFLNIISFLFILLPTIPILLLSGLGKDFIMAFKAGREIRYIRSVPYSKRNEY